MVNEIRLVANLLTDTEFNTETKPIILTKYDELISKMFQEEQLKTISHNFVNYATLLNFDVYMAVMLNTAISDIINYKALYNAFRVAKSNSGDNNVKAYKYLREQMVKVIEKNGYPIVGEVTEEMINESIRTLDLQVAEEVSVDELADMDFTDEEMEAGIFGDDIIEDEGVNESSEDNDTYETNTPEPSEPEAEPDVELNVPEDDKSDDEDDKSFTDKKKALLNSRHGNNIERISKRISEYIGDMYLPAFTGLGYDGIMIRQDPPLAKLNSKNHAKLSKEDRGTSDDLNIFNAIARVNTHFNKLVELPDTDGKEIVPDTNMIMSGEGIFTHLHLAFETANVNFTKGLVSIRKWVHETKKQTFENWYKEGNSGSTTTLVRTADIQEWYTWCITNIICKCLIDLGFDVKGSSSDLINSVANKVGNIRNIVVVTEREIGAKTDIIIGNNLIQAGDNEYKGKIVSAISSELQASGAIVKEMAADRFNRSGILTLSIIMDKKKAEKPQLFAADVLDRIIASGSIPSWSNVLLGKKEDGTMKYWKKFMNAEKASPSDRCYTIYADSRSGKGIMTSTLIASALADKKQVFYTDRKPENGAALGMIAWKQGKEAYVFDGSSEPKDPFSEGLDAYTYGVRDGAKEKQINFAKNTPSDLFENAKYFSDNNKDKFFGLMRYLKSIHVMLLVGKERSAGTIPKDTWQVWIFDEMTKMAGDERDIRKVFAKYIIDKFPNLGSAKDKDVVLNNALVVKAMKDEKAKADDGVQYIVQWASWVKSFEQYIEAFSTIDLGKADMNLIFIFQKSSWLFDNSDGRENTLIYYMARMFKGVKIMGANALDGTNSKDYGNGNTFNEDWYKDLSANSKWAVSTGVDIKAGREIFKPYNIYTIPYDNNTKLIKSGQTTNGCPIEDYVSEEDTRYLYGYIHKLFKEFNKMFKEFNADPADVLQSAYDYAERVVVQKELAGSLQDYIYDCTNFGSVDVDASWNAYEQKSEASEGYGWSSEEDDEFDTKETDNDDEEYIDCGMDGVIEDNSPKTSQSPNQPVTSPTSTMSPNGDVKMRFMTTKDLIDKRFDDNSIIQYVGHYSIINKVILPNRFDLSDRDTKSNKGLYIASIVLSTLHYYCSVRHLDEVMKYKQALNNTILNGSEGNENAKIYCGMLEDYDNGTLEYDTMPSQEKMRGYQSKFVKAETEWSNMESGPFGAASEDDFEYGEDNSNYSDAAMPDEVVKVVQPSFSFNIKGEVVLTRRPTQEVVITPPETFINAEIPKYSMIEKMKKKLFESRTGTSYEFKKRWDYVLDAIEKEMPNKSMITRVAIVGQNIAVNGKTLKLQGILGGEYDVRMEDIIHIERLLKRFKSIQELILDSLGMQQFIIEYGANSVGVKNVFDKAKSLRRLGFIPSGEGKPIVYTREGLLAQEAKLKQQLREEELKMKIENAAARKNPRLHEKSPGATAKFFKSSAALSGDTFKKALSMATDKNPKLIRATAVSVVGLGIIGVGSIVGLFGLAGKGIGKLASLGKR